MKEIIITASSILKDAFDDLLIPAIKQLPTWFKEMPSTVDNQKLHHWRVNDGPNFSMKKCIPLRDALTAGYYLTTPVDIFVEQTNDGPSITWGADLQVIETQNHHQLQTFPVPKGFESNPVFKWVNFYVINTPKGYSTLFVHPLFDRESPFYTLSGFVETDKYNLPVNFPFFIKKDFEGVIEKGTPFVQFIPIKREKWKIHKNSPLTPLENTQRMNYLRQKFSGYRELFWERKEYK